MTAKDLYQLLARNLKFLRAIHDMTQDNLAEAVGISKNYLAEIETAKKYPSAAVFLRLAMALDVEPFRLLYPEATAASLSRIEQAYSDKTTEQFTRDVAELFNKYRHEPSDPQADKKPDD